MKRYPLFLLALLMSCFSVGEALPLGNPCEASLFEDGVLFGKGEGWFSPFMLRGGFYGDYVHNRYLQVSQGRGHSEIQTTNIQTDAAYLALNICQWADVFATVGNSRIRVETPRSAWAIGPVPNAETFWWQHPAFSWSVGARVTLWELACWGIGLESQYFSMRPKLDTYHPEGIIESLVDGHLKYQEWQIGLGLTYRIQVISCRTAVLPYVGIQYARVWTSASDNLTVDRNNNVAFFDMRQAYPVGYTVGIAFVGSSCWSLLAEARFINEKAYSIKAQCVF